MSDLDKNIKSQILKEIKSFVKKEKTYQNYTVCMEELSIWLGKKAK